VSTLVVVPCGKQKIWASKPDAGPTAAKDAYTGAPFKVNRRYAEARGGDWVVLSARYGFLEPDEVIPGPYEATFNSQKSRPIDLLELRLQVGYRRLDRYTEVIGLGGAEYQAALRMAFGLTCVPVTFPFAGLAIGRAMAATAEATQRLTGVKPVQ
jgi:Family of unknown function (DUF6884)